MTCLGENTSKYIDFTVPIEHKFARTEINKEEFTKSVSYMLQFIERARFMVSSLLSLINNHSEEIHKINCKIQTRRLKI